MVKILYLIILSYLISFGIRTLYTIQNITGLDTSKRSFALQLKHHKLLRKLLAINN